MKYRVLNFTRQFALMLLVIWTVVSLVTLLIEVVPGDPATVILGETATQELAVGGAKMSYTIAETEHVLLR